MKLQSWVLFFFLFVSISFSTVFATSVTSTSPASNSTSVASTSTIQVTFSQGMDPSLFNDSSSFLVTGMLSGRHYGSFSFSPDSTIVTFTPTTPFRYGEKVVVNVTNKLKDDASVFITAYSYTFWIQAESSAGIFSSKVSYATGNGPQAAHISDIDGDGDGDLVVINYADNTISTFTNNGNGIFSNRQNYSTGANPLNLSSADFDLDGDEDLVVANYGSNTFSIKLNNGSGIFANANYSTGAGSSPYGADAGDLNGDGYPDIAVAENGDDRVSIYINDGDGTFTSTVQYTTPNLPISVKIHDVDGDGDADIILSSTGVETISIYKNNGGGTFAARTDYTTGVTPRGTAIADFDGDGDADIAVANYTDDNISIFKNNGNGTFAARVNYTTGNAPWGVEAGDIDGDGDIDLIAPNYGAISVSILKNNGNATFATKVDYATESNPRFLSIGDLNGDNIIDIAVPNYGSDNFSILLGVKRYTITSTAGEDGSISPSGTVLINAGNDTTFTFTPAVGYQVDSVLVDDSPVTTATSYTFTNVTTNHTIRVVFRPNPAQFSVSPNSFSYGNVVVGQTKLDSVTVTNSGGVALSITNVSSDNAQYTITPTSASVNPSGTVKFYITFAPTASGASNSTISFTHDPSGSPGTISVSGSGITPLFSVSSTSLSFGDVRTGQSKQDSVIVTNTGTASLTITSVISNNARYTVSPASSTVSAGASKTFIVTFAPLATGNLTGEIVFTHNADGSPDTVTVSGNGTAPQFSVAPNSISFGDVLVNGSKQDSVTVTNTGTATLNISNVTSNNARFVVNSTSGSIAPGATQKFLITFSPTATGNQSGTLSFASDGSGSPHTVSLSGKGISPSISLSASSKTYGSVLVGQTKKDSVTISNPGTDTLKIRSIVLSGNQYSVSPASLNIVPAGSAKLYVTFVPTSEGAKADSVSLTHNAAGSPSKIVVSGTGIAPQFAVNGTQRSLGNVTPNTQKKDTIIVTNSGSVLLQINSVVSSNSKFTITPTSGSVPLGGGTLKLFVTYTPTTLTYDTSRITFTHGASGSPSVVTLTGQGYAGIYSSSVTSLNFGNVNKLATKTDSITISNTGNKPITISRVVAGTSVINQAPFAVTPTTATINPNSNKKFYVSCTPTQTGTVTGYVEFTFDAAGSPKTITLNGKGTAPAISLPATTKTFATTVLAETRKDSVTITNSGDAVLKLTSITSNSDQFSVSPSADSVAPAGTKKIYINFTPTSIGTKSGKIFISHNVPNRGTDSISLTGTVGNPNFYVTRSDGIPFGLVSTATTKTDTLTIVNNETVALTIYAVEEGDSSFTISPSSNIQLAPNTSTKATITFTPRSTGFKSKLIKFRAVGRTFPDVGRTVQLTGTGYNSPGYAFNADVSNSYVASPLSDSLKLSGDVTMTFWVKVASNPSVTSGTQKFITKEYFYADFNYGSNKLGFYYPGTGTSGANGIYTEAPIQRNRWYHIAIVVSQTKKLATLYVNGENASFTPITAIKPLQAIVGGQIKIGGSSFVGEIDEFLIWKKEESEPTLRSWMSKTITSSHPDYSKLYFYLDFNDSIRGSGTNSILDKSRLRNHSTWVGSSSAPLIPSGCGVDVPLFTVQRTGQFIASGFGNVFTGDSKTDSTTMIANIGGQQLNVDVSLSDNTNYRLATTSYSLAPGESKQFPLTYAPATGSNTNFGLIHDTKLFFSHNSGNSSKTDTLATTGRAFDVVGSNNKNLQSIKNFSNLRVRNLPFSDTYTIAFWGYYSSSMQIKIGANITLNSTHIPYVADKWYHCALTLENVAPSTLRIQQYVNGVSQNTLTLNTLLQNNFDSLQVLLSNNKYLDELSIWNTKLPTAEIKNLSRYSNARLSPYNASLQALYRFEDEASGIAYDSSGNNRNGTFDNVSNVREFLSGAPTGEPFINIASWNFGTVALNSVSTKSSTIFNTGNQTLTSEVVSTNSAFFINENLSAISPAMLQPFTITFNPKVYGEFAETLKVNHNGKSSPTRIRVSGRCVGPTTLNVPVSFDLGDVAYGYSVTKKFAVKNTGNAPAHIQGVSEQYVGSPVFVCSPTSFTLAAGATDSIAVTFTPDTFGTYSSSFHKILISTENAESHTIPVQGRGKYQGNLRVPSVTLNYDTARVFAANNKSFYIRNTGTGTLIISNYGGSNPEISGSGPSEILPGDSGLVTIKLFPRKTGSSNGKIFITSFKVGPNSTAFSAIDSTITYSSTATIRPLTDADKAFMSTPSEYREASNKDNGNPIQFDTAFTIEMWTKPFSVNQVILNNSNAVKVGMYQQNIEKVTTTIVRRSDGTRDTTKTTSYQNSGGSVQFEMNNTTYMFGNDVFDSVAYYSQNLTSYIYEYHGFKGKMTPNFWHHLAFTWKAGDSLYCYLNGIKIGSGFIPGTSVSYPLIDTNYLSLTPGNAIFDEVILWDRVKSQTEILSSYNSGLGTTDKMKAYWKFSEPSGDLYSDVSGNGHDLTIVGSKTNYPSSSLPVSSATMTTSASSINIGAVDINSVVERSLTLTTNGKPIGVRVEHTDTTYFSLPNRYSAAWSQGTTFLVASNPKGLLGSKRDTLTFLNLSTNQVLKTVTLQAFGISNTVMGKFYNGSNNSVILPTPVTVRLIDNKTMLAVRETTTTQQYKFDYVPPGNYSIYQSGIIPYYYTESDGTCRINNGIPSYMMSVTVNANLPSSVALVNNSYETRTDYTFQTGSAFPATLCTGLRSASSRMKSSMLVDTVSWTNPVEWGGVLPSDTADIVVAYPGFYDQLSIKLDLTELNTFCSVNTCTGDVTTLRNFYLADSAKMLVAGNGAWKITNDFNVAGTMLLDVDSNATLTFGNFLVTGTLTIPEGKNPTIIINGNMTVAGTFNPGNSTIILNGMPLNKISAPLAQGDSLQKTVHFHNLIMNSDSTIIADNIEIANQLTLNANVSIEIPGEDEQEKFIGVSLTSTSPEAITGTGMILNGALARAIDETTPASYRFHTPGTIVEFTSPDNLPSSIFMNRLASGDANTMYKVFKGGTVNDEMNTVLLSNVSPDGEWTFASTNYPNGETTIGGSRYQIAVDGSANVHANLSLGYDLAQLNGLDESALGLLKNTAALRISNLADVDGDNISESDRTAQEWEVSVYRDSVLESNYIGTYSGSEILVDDLTSGKYLIVPNDSTGWKTLARSVNANPYPESLATISVSTEAGIVSEVSYTRYQVMVIHATADGGGEISPSGMIEIPLHGTVEFTVVPDAGNRVDKLIVDGTELAEADSFTFSDVTENHTISASFEFDDSTKFRTIAYDVELSKVPSKIVFRNGKLQYPPNLGTAVEALFKKLGRNGATFVGIPQVTKDSAKQYSWLNYRKSVEFRRMFTKEHGDVYFPIDSTKNRRQQLHGGLRPNRNTYNNKAWEQSILFKLNLLASQYNITPPNFGALVLDTNVTLFGRDLTGTTLVDISLYLDSVMTYWKKYGVDNATAYGELRDFMMNVIQPINEGFSAPLTTANVEIDSIAVNRDRNTFAMKLLGVARASDTKLVRLVPGIKPSKIEQTEGFENLPTEYALYQNYPNPFNPSTTIEFDLNSDSRVTLKVYNILGQIVATLVDGEMWDAGNQMVEFDARNFASGVYFYRFEATSVVGEGDINSFTDVKKMILIK